MLPAETTKELYQGPEEEVPTFFDRARPRVGSFTSTLAVAVLPVPPLVELTVTVLVFRPVVVPVTLREKVQEALPAKVAPDRLTVPEPAVAVIVPPPQLPDRPLGLATVKPEGRLSVKFTPVREVDVLGFVIVNESEVVPLVRMELAPKALLIDGAESTVNEEIPCPVDVLLMPPELLI